MPITAELERRASAWAWTRFRAVVRVAAGAATIVARARESEGGGQPEHPREAWNAKGYQNNAWYRVPVIAG